MSADNYYDVAQNPETGKWHVAMGFLSVEEHVDAEALLDGEVFDTEDAAIHWAMDQYTEYGVSTTRWPL